MKWFFWTLLLVVVVIAWLISKAGAGVDAAWFALGVIAAVLLVLAGATITLAAVGMMNRKHSQDFSLNARENAALLAQAKALIQFQNTQNKVWADQAKRGQLLPPQGGLVVEEGIFDELRNEAEQ